MRAETKNTHAKSMVKNGRAGMAKLKKTRGILGKTLGNGATKKASKNAFLLQKWTKNGGELGQNPAIFGHI